MANLVVLTSGNGSNFQAIAEAVQKDGRHKIVCMICNKKEAFSFVRAQNLGIKAVYIGYKDKTREEVESEIISILHDHHADLIALAGYMKLLTPVLLDAYAGKIINIHPALLPKYPGAHGIEESYNSADKELGVSIHYVDYGMDTGPIIAQRSFIRKESDSLESVEEKLHKLEHQAYPEVVLALLNEIDNKKNLS